MTRPRFRRNNRSGRRSYNPRYRSPRSNLTLFGKKQLIRLRYHEELELSVLGADGLVARRAYSSNGIFDPSFDTVGHQPRGFDEVIALFHNYTVIASTMTATFAPTPATSSVVCGVALRGGPGGLLSPNSYLEGRLVTFATLATEASALPLRISRRFSPKEFLGISKPLASQAIRGSQTTNPDLQAFFHVFLAPFGTLGSNSTVLVTVDMMFTVVFTEPKTPIES